MKLKIIQVLKNDMWGQFSATYLDDTQLKLEISKNSSEQADIVYLNKSDIVTLDVMQLSKLKELDAGVEVEFNDFILTPYAKNPKRNLVVIATGVVRIATSQPQI